MALDRSPEFCLQFLIYVYSKTGVKRLLSKRQKIGFQDQLSPNAGRKYCRMLARRRKTKYPTVYPTIYLPK